MNGPKGPLGPVVVAILMVTLCISALCGKLVLDERTAALDQALEVSGRSIATLETEIKRTIESYNLSLEAVVDNLKYDEISKVSPSVRQALLFDRSTTAKHLHAISLLDERGIVRLDSRTPFPAPTNDSARDYFQAHEGSKPSALYVSAPFLAPDTHRQVIALSRRLSGTDGSFAGVVVGTIYVSYFEELFAKASRHDDGVSLLRADGTLLARWPAANDTPGREPENSGLSEHFPASRVGYFESRNSETGVQSIVAFGQVGDLPLVLAVSQPTSEIYAKWRRYALTVGALVALLCAMSAILSAHLIREIRRRNAAEIALAALATEDSVTGLANRRHFDDVIAREWQRATRKGSPISLIMCDTDHFKQYNDTFGHQAGDKLLQVVGTVLSQSIRHNLDLAARYGGDEFIVLLPNTAMDRAEGVAERIRNEFAKAIDRQGIPYASLSIGLASTVPARTENLSSLIAAADKAAYCAKQNGRDRIETASSREFRLSLAEGG